MPIPVACASVLEYESTFLDAVCGIVLEECGFAPSPGDRVLVKPNLVSRSNGHLSCTNAQVVRAACTWLLDRGARVTVADSPAFGSAASVARAVGIAEAIAPLGLQVTNLGSPVSRQTSFDATISISRQALETDAILNLPKLKVHCQMRLTGAVKNLFGCVVGLRKPLAHARFGEKGTRFEAMILDLVGMLPPVTSLMDAIRPMHRNGPVNGDPYDLGLVAASASPVALDTALYTLLAQHPDQLPLWQEAQRRGLPGATFNDLRFPMEPLSNFDASTFVVPADLTPVSFAPHRLLQGRIKSMLHRLG
ncbi:MAG: DUF362 domain-containing protein [Proteobacteria bacterium]|nr:DUF362 domain-containing protein [Pseudomonadota bacterium]MBU1612342.1 DUF362 domain-containing protein [Pseudomonadota bacterium]